MTLRRFREPVPLKQMEKAMLALGCFPCPNVKRGTGPRAYRDPATGRQCTFQARGDGRVPLAAIERVLTAMKWGEDTLYYTVVGRPRPAE